MVTGTASVTRMAKWGATKVSIAAWLARSGPADGAWSLPAGTVFEATLHRQPCSEEGGGDEYHHPLFCQGGQCNEARESMFSARGVAVRALLALPLEVRNGARILVGELDWSTYVPASWDGKSIEDGLSAVISYPAPGGGMQRFACATLSPERRSNGRAHQVRQSAAGHVPYVVAHLTRTELGTSDVAVDLHNLQQGVHYFSYVQTTPCVAGDDSSIRFEHDGAPVRLTAVPSASGGAVLQTGAASTTLPTVLPAAAQAISIYECLDGDGAGDTTGACAGGESFLICMDLLNEDNREHSSTVAPPKVTTTSTTTTTTTTSTPEPEADATTAEAAVVTVAPTVVVDGAKEEPDCPHVYYSGVQQGEVQLDTAGGMCCFAAKGPPSSLRAVTTWADHHDATASPLIAGLVGIAGLTCIAMAALLIVHRRLVGYDRVEQGGGDEYSVGHYGAAALGEEYNSEDGEDTYAAF